MTDSQQDQAAVEARARELLAAAMKAEWHEIYDTVVIDKKGIPTGEIIERPWSEWLHRAGNAPASLAAIRAALSTPADPVAVLGEEPTADEIALLLNTTLGADWDETHEEALVAGWKAARVGQDVYPEAMCEPCNKPVLRGQFVHCYEDVGEVHVDCDHPFAVSDDPEAVIMAGAPLQRVRLAALAQQPALPAGGDASDMAAFGASDAACYYYPGEDQQKERTAFCAGAVHHHAPIREGALREAAAVARSHDYMQCGPHTREVTTAIEAAILARIDSPTAAVPTVPRAPTEVMIEAGARAYDFPSAFMGGGSQQGKQTAARVWTAMEASRIRALSPNEASDGL